jgi:hypothetical protein
MWTQQRKERWEMKKLIALFTVAMFLLLVGSAAAVDQKGKIGVGAYGGYSVGFGDCFKKWEFGDYSSQNKASFCFGGKGKYGLTPNISLMAAVEYQAGKWEGEGTLPYLGDVSESENWHWIAILANVQYVLMQEQKTTPYLIAGGGFYMPDEGDSKPGINLGVGVEHFFQENLALDGGVRFHMIFSESGDDDVDYDYNGSGLSFSAEDDEEGGWDNITYLQIHVGVIYYFGAK